MKRIIRLTESDLARIVRRVIKEQNEPTPMEDLPFNLEYFEKNPTGTIQMEPYMPNPLIIKINDISLDYKDPKYNFENYWDGYGIDLGRGFRSGNGKFTYTFDGSKITFKKASDNNEFGSHCSKMPCYFELIKK